MNTTEQLKEDWHKAERALTQIHAENGGGQFRSPESICLHRTATEAMTAYMTAKYGAGWRQMLPCPEQG